MMQLDMPLLPPCPDTPNCVSSLSENPKRRVDPFPMTDSAAESLSLLEEIVLSMPRTRITLISDGKMQAEFLSRLGFVDDVMFVPSEDEGVIHVRSASRTGSWDLGVNRRRVERIRGKYINVISEQ